MGMGQESVAALRDVGELLAFLKQPEPPKDLRDLWEKRHDFKQVLNMPVKSVKKAPCQEIVLEGDQVDLGQIPIQTCWPGRCGTADNLASGDYPWSRQRAAKSGYLSHAKAGQK